MMENPQCLECGAGKYDTLSIINGICVECDRRDNMDSLPERIEAAEVAR